jgi:GDP-L-fucose synthase
MAAASVHVMNLAKDKYESCTSPMTSHINVGYGSDITIAELAHLISKVVGYPGKLEFDATKPDGAPRKLMDSSRLKNLGWQPKIELNEGLKRAYQDFLVSSTQRR